MGSVIGSAERALAVLNTRMMRLKSLRTMNATERRGGTLGQNANILTENGILSAVHFAHAVNHLETVIHTSNKVGHDCSRSHY